MPGWDCPARPAVYKVPIGAQVASPQSPILRWSTSRISALTLGTRGAKQKSGFANYSCPVLLAPRQLIRRTLKTKVLSVAKLRLGDLEKKERQLAEHQVAVADGSITVDDALATYRQRLEGDASIKPRTREYHQQRITALFKSWPELKRTEVRSVTKTDCLNWAARLARTPVRQCSITYTEGPGC